MKWNPAPPEAVSAFAAATKDIEGLERRKMFGYDAVFAHNRMVAGLHEVGMVLRLPDEDRERFVAEHQSKPFVVMGRVMREYVVVPESLYADTKALSRWVRDGLDYAASLPPKSKSGPNGKKKAAAKTKPAPPKPTRPAPAPSKAARSKTTKAGKAKPAGNATQETAVQGGSRAPHPLRARPRPSSRARLEQDLDATVLLPAARAVVVGDRVALAVALSHAGSRAAAD